MKFLKFTSLCALAAAAWFHPTSVKAEVVYNNSTILTGSFNPGIIEVGDEITLAGLGRTITNFTLQYSGVSFSGSEQLRLRFYANDGALVSGYAAPSTLLYDSGAFGVSGPSTGETLIFDDFGSWNGIVPDSFTWSLQFSNLGVGATPSISLFNPVTVGSSFDDYWENNGTWVLKQGTGPINFGATVEAVPEPSTLALGLIGAVGGVLVYRRQRR